MVMNDLNKALEAFYYAHRAIIARPDAILAQYGLSRVHHRILYFIARQPGLSVNDLLKCLDVTKQSLSAPMRKLLELRLVAAEVDVFDRRIKRLRLTADGEHLEHELTTHQRKRFAKAFDAAGPEGKAFWFQVMQHLTAD
jgi:DNA-binding MarR family transcriptional regulator